MRSDPRTNRKELTSPSDLYSVRLYASTLTRRDAFRASFQNILATPLVGSPYPGIAKLTEVHFPLTRLMFN
jgi:hypothetical protein